MSEFDYKETRPARSDLFSLKPVGLGTSGVESLESYTCRLARLHGVARHSIEKFVNQQGDAIYLNCSGPPRLDSPTEPALRFASRLAELTRQPLVAALGLGRFANRLSTMHTLRRYRAWCGDCFCDARKASAPAHLPLVWSLVEYQRCLVHQQVLETQCRSCLRPAVASNSWSRDIDHCPWCNCDLATRRKGGAPSRVHLTRRRDAELDMFTSVVLGEFVAKASTSVLPAHAPDIGRMVGSAIERDVASCPAHIAKVAGLSVPTLHTIMSGRNNPSLVVILRLAAATDVSMAGLFYPEFWQEGVRGAAPPALSEAPRLRNNRQHDWAQIRRDTSAALTQGDAISLQRMARRLGLDQSYFAERIGDMRQAILERGKVTREAERKAKLVELTEMVRQAGEALRSQGVRVTARAIGKALARPTGSPYMRQALKLAMA